MRTFTKLLALLALSGTLQAQDGAIDPSFNTNDLGHGSGGGANARVNVVARQPDGKILVGGVFGSFNGFTRTLLTRLNADGSTDLGFSNSLTVSGSELRGIAVQPDGKIIIVGHFIVSNGGNPGHIARLNTDGTIDASFNAVADIFSSQGLNCVALQADGKILVGGGFSTFNSIAAENITRLEPSGALDVSFNSNASTNTSGHVNCMAIQPDGKILIAGYFNQVNGAARDGLARLNADGTLDAGFVPTGAGENAIALQPDGKVLTGGYNVLWRFNANGTTDATFNIGAGVAGSVLSIALQSTGKIILGGDFTDYNASGKSRIARLNTDGSVDPTFSALLTLDSWVTSKLVLPDDKIVIAGAFTRAAGAMRNRFCGLNSDGSLDPSFNPPTGAVSDDLAEVLAIATQPDGKVLVGGTFTNYFGADRVRLARLEPDGALDPSFSGLAGADGKVSVIQLQPDGRILIGGSFTSYDGVTRSRLARLNPNGTLDLTFDPGAGANDAVESIALQPDGKIIIGGWFTQWNGVARARLARLNADGSLDTGFDPGTGASFIILDVLLQTDGTMYITGNFTSYNGVARSRVARVSSTGALDLTFDPGTGANNLVLDMALQPDGKLILFGQFTAINGVNRNCIARLDPNGSIDASFDPGTGTGSARIQSVALQPDGKIIIGGTFQTYRGATRRGLARVNPNGTNDISFTNGIGVAIPPVSLTSTMNDIEVLPDGNLMIGGGFKKYDNVGRNRIARVLGTAHTNIRLVLEGPYSSGSMSDALRTLPSFPLTEPFTAMGYSEAGYTPGATIAPNVLTITGNNAIVDWVLVEMRPVATPSVVAASRAVLLQRDGDVVDLDGVGTVGFSGLAHGNYCIVVKPRNHLPVMLSPSTPFAYGTSTATVDFTLPGTQVYDNDARKNVGGVMVLAAGDVTFNELIQYVGAGNDRDPILQRIGGAVPTATLAGYWPEDVNMDGIVKYIGANNDRDPILLNVGGSTPTAVRNAQLP